MKNMIKKGGKMMSFSGAENVSNNNGSNKGIVNDEELNRAN